MHISSAVFTVSSQKLSQCPTDGLPEFALIGRSNVGKSSLINMLTDRPGLAKVSSTPGKTRLINHFKINAKWYLVDLPGYGYARVSKNQRGEFSKLITDYVQKREAMVFLVRADRFPARSAEDRPRFYPDARRTRRAVRVDIHQMRQTVR